MLIEIVVKHAELFDPKLPDYRDANFKKNTWTSVANELPLEATTGTSYKLNFH